MEAEPQVARVDLVSRILSILSLVVALSAVGYFVTQMQVASTEEALVQKFDERLQDQVTKYQQDKERAEQQLREALARVDDRMKQWDDRLVAALDAIDQDAKSLLADIRHQTNLDQKLEQLAFEGPVQTDRPAGGTDGDGNGEDRVAANSSAADASASGGNQDLAIGGWQSAAGSAASPSPEGSQTRTATAKLVVVQSALRAGENDLGLIPVRNTTTSEAVVKRIRFRPTSDFQATGDGSFSALRVNDELITIAFAPSDNTSTKPGHHGIYIRTLSQPVRIPAGETVNLRLVIDNAKHRGWGLQGEVDVEYDDGQVLKVNAARVRFEPLGST